MKTYILDTNILMKDADAIYKFEDNKVVIPLVVIQELDKHKCDSGLLGYNCRKALRNIEDSNSIELRDYTELDWIENNDDKIISTIKDKSEILVSNDYGVRAKCKLLNRLAEEYKNIPSIELGELRKGKHIITDINLLSEFYQYGKLKIIDNMYENDFVIFEVDNKIQEFAKVVNNEIVRARVYENSVSGIKAKSLEQKMAISHLMNNDLELITLTAKAGTGKTFLILASALELIDKKQYKKIYIAKSPIPLSKEVYTGYKKGGIFDKYIGSLGSITSNLENMGNRDKKVTGLDLLEGYINFGIIEILHIEDILGMSLNPNSILIIEEAETLSKDTMKAILTRVGENSKVMINADLAQHGANNLIPEETGLYHLINCFAGYKKYAHFVMENVIRSNFVNEIHERW